MLFTHPGCKPYRFYHSLFEVSDFVTSMFLEDLNLIELFTKVCPTKFTDYMLINL